MRVDRQEEEVKKMRSRRRRRLLLEGSGYTGRIYPISSHGIIHVRFFGSCFGLPLRHVLSASEPRGSRSFGHHGHHGSHGLQLGIVTVL
jgi:hypothetical protein